MPDREQERLVLFSETHRESTVTYGRETKTVVSGNSSWTLSDHTRYHIVFNVIAKLIWSKYHSPTFVLAKSIAIPRS